MGKPKKRTTPRRTGNRRSHHFAKLAKRVNATSPIKVSLKSMSVKPQVTASTAKPAKEKVVNQ